MVMLKRYLMVALIGALLLGVSASPAVADGEKDPELEEAWRQMLEWVEQAKELKADGQHEKAKALMQKADKLKQAVKEHKRRLEAKREHDELMEKAEYYFKKGETKKAEAMKRKAMAVREEVAGRTKKQAAKGAEAELKKLLHDLEVGARALRKLGKNDMADDVIGLAHDVAGRLREMRAHRKEGQKKEHGDKERQMAKRHIEIIRSGIPFVVESGHTKAAEQLERAVHALELRLAGRRDKEAKQAYENGPDNAAMTELLAFAANRARKQDDPKSAAPLEELAQHYRARWKKDEARKQGKGKKDGGAKERRMAEKHVEIIKAGVGVLVRADQHGAAEQLEQAAHAIELQLEGRRDEEARKIIKSGPGFGQMTELLMFAAKHAAEQSAHEQAGRLKELSQHYRKRWERNRKKGKGEKSEQAEQRRRMQKRHPVPEDDLGLLRQAVVGLAEGNRHEAAERVEQAEHWRRLWAEGHRGPDARDIRRAAPSAAELARLLRTAADLWASWHHPAMGKALDRFANRLAPREKRANSNKRAELLERLEQLEMQLQELREAARR